MIAQVHPYQDQNYTDLLPRQESYFYYLFGVTELTGMYAMIDLDTEKTTLFMPEPNPIYKIWMHVMSKEDIQKKYGFDVLFLPQLKEKIEQKAPVSGLLANHLRQLWHQQ